jgi:aldose 1-epimerase
MTSNFLLSTTSGIINISSQGARILNWRIINKTKDNFSILEATDKIDNWFESAVLFPWVNRLENGTSILRNKSVKLSDLDEGLHGLVFDADFECTFQTENKIVLRLLPKQMTVFPFSFDFQVTYELLEDILSVQFKVENNDLIKMPFAVGWHPYFLFPDDTTITIYEVENHICDSNRIPTRETIYHNKISFTMKDMPDNLYLVKNGMVFIHSSEFELEIFTQNMPFFQFFQNKLHRGFAIEPMSGAGNCLNNKIGLLEIEPNSVWEGKVQVKFKRKI